MGRGGNSINWDDTRVSFNDANAAMGNAGAGISQAGNVFGQLTKLVLDEQQKAVDNQYRAQLFDENVKQFGMQHALAQDALGEEILSNRNTEGLTARGQDIQSRGQDLSYKASMASVGAQNSRNALLQKQYDDAKRKDEARQKAFQDVIEDRNTLDSKIAQRDSLVGPMTPEMSGQLDREKELRKSMTANNLLQEAALKASGYGDYTLAQEVLAKEAANEQSRATLGVEQKKNQQKALEQSQLNSSKMIDSLNLVPGDKSKVTSAVTQLVAAYGISPEVATSAIISMYPTTGAWTSFSGQQKLDTPFFEVGDKLDNFNATDIKNPIVQAVLPYIKDKKNIPTEKEDVASPPSSPLSRPVDLSTLTDSALKYREDQLTSSLPKPSDVEAKDPDVQNIYKELYRQSQGNRDITNVPKEELQALQEKAEKLAAVERQQILESRLKEISREKKKRASTYTVTGLSTYLGQ